MYLYLDTNTSTNDTDNQDGCEMEIDNPECGSNNYAESIPAETLSNHHMPYINEGRKLLNTWD